MSLVPANGSARVEGFRNRPRDRVWDPAEVSWLVLWLLFWTLGCSGHVLGHISWGRWREVV